MSEFETAMTDSENDALETENQVTGLGCDARMVLCAFDDLQDIENLDVSVEGRADALNLNIPAFSNADAQTLVRLLIKLSDDANAEGEKIDARAPH